MKSLCPPFVIIAVLVALAQAADTPAPSRVAFNEERSALEVAVDGRTVATYVFEDEAVHRPYFAHVKTLTGTQVTRNHPPVKDVDPVDHANMHPGLWMAFSDLGGRDFWRNKGPRVVQEKLTRHDDSGAFDVVNKYLDGETVIGRETVRFTISAHATGYLLIWDSTLEPQIEGLWMGGVEEMGLGVRIATPLSVKAGKGKIINSAGGENEAGTWGKTADWCDYSGPLGGKHVGITLMADPANPHKSWFHNRNYGLMVANSFGERAGAPKRLELQKGTPVRFRFGLLVHETKDAAAIDLPSEYEAFVKSLAPR